MAVLGGCLQLRVAQVLLLAFCLGANGYLVNFEPGTSYDYEYEATTELQNAGVIDTEATISIHWLEDTPDGQHCQMVVKSINYQLIHDLEGIIGDYGNSNDFSKWYSFVISRHGEILSVFYEEDETEVVVLLKKILLGTLSAKLHATEGALAKGAPWAYRVNETGHEGGHESTYSVHKTPDGLKFQKTKHGHVVPNSDAAHNKDILYDNSLQVPHTITVKEHFTAPKKAPPGFDAHAGLPGDNAKHRAASAPADFELPDMHGNSHGTLRFIGQSEHIVINGDEARPVDLIEDTLKIDKVPLPRYKFWSVEDDILSNMTCMRKHQSPMAQEKSKCFYHLVEMVSRLPSENITYLAETYIRPHATTADETRNREIIIDTLGATATETSQIFLTDLVLKTKHPNASLIMRTLIHFVQLKYPPPEVFVDALEDIAIYGQIQFADPDDTWLVHNRAVLVLGSVARDLKSSKKKRDRERGDAILKSLEDSLEVHDPFHHRQLRSTMTEDEYHEHVTWKATLMQALGNAASPSSYHHILSYLNNSDNHPMLRRSGIYAVGKYKISEASTALLKTALEDVDENVRYVASIEYIKHPHSDENVNLGHPFSDRTALNRSDGEPKSRSRRGIFDGIQFKLATPRVDWRKDVGTDDIGGKIGLIMRNEFDLDIKPLEGSIKIDVYDHAYLVGVIGYIGKKFTFVDAKVCFRGDGSYSLNILQEFGFSDIKSLVNFFDSVVGNIVDAVKNAIEVFKTLLSPNSVPLEDIFENFVRAVMELPNKVKNVRHIGKEVIRRIGKYSGLPEFFKDVGNVVERVSALFTAIRTDVMELYNSINDAATITIPWVGQQLEDAIPTIAGALKKLFKSPKAAINDIARFIMQIKGAVAVVIDAKKRIEDACFFTEGNQPYWFDMKTELEGIWDDILKAKDSLADAVSWVNEGGDSDDEIFYYTGKTKAEFRRLILADITGALDVFTEPLNELEELAKPFVDAYDAVFSVIAAAKEGYEGVKLGYEFAKTLLNKIFGSKSAAEFPRKFAETSCGEGFYPSTAGNTHPGVDLEIEVGATLVSPFTGDVRRSGPTQLIIAISDEIKDTEVIIDHVDLDDDKDERMIFKSMALGKVVSSGCSPNAIHLSMRKVGTQDYIDPTSYIEKRKMFKPEWKQHCDEYYIDVFTETTISGPGRITKGPQDTDESPARTSEPDTSDVDDQKPVRENNPIDWGKGVLDRLGLPKIDDRGPLFNFRLSSIRLGDIFGFLDAAGQTSIRIRLQDMLDDLQLKLGSLVWDFRRPETLSDDELKTILKGRLKSVESASRPNLIKMYREIEMRCTDLQEFLPKNSFCWFDEDCLGVQCNIEVDGLYLPIKIKAFARLDPCQLQFRVGVNDWSQEFDLEDLLSDGPFEDTGHIEENIELFDFLEVSFRYRIERDGLLVKFDLEAGVCSTKVIDHCSPFLKVFKGLSLQMVTCDGSSTSSSRKRRSAVLSLEDIPLDRFEDLLDIVDIDVDTVNGLMNDVMTIVKEESIDKILTALTERVQDEFLNFDLKLSGGKVFGPYELEFIKPQWYSFALGPIPMMFGFGAGGSFQLKFSTEAAILSMSLQINARPELGCFVWGSLAIGIPMFYAELRLVGYLMTTGFPTQAKITFSSFPIDVDARMDMVLVPLKLELRARLVFELDTPFFSIKEVLINVKLWGYTSPQIDKNIFNKGELEPDKTPPTFRKVSIPENDLEKDYARALAPITHCTVSQVVGRDFVDPAFELAVAVDDDRSEVDLTFCVGTYQSGCDVLKDQTMGGASVIVAAILPGGIPLHFTVKAVNSAKEVAMATCSVTTYDITLPSGRITPDFYSTSRPDVLRASAVVHDDSVLFDQKEGVGFGLGILGDQTVPWNDVSLQAVGSGVILSKALPLDQFTSERKGRLDSIPHGVTSFSSAYKCAEYCLRFPPTKCISFNYDFGDSGSCEPLQEIEGHEVELHESGYFHYFERLGVGHTVQFDHEDLQLRHADTHYFNMYMLNSLGYENVITSKAVVVDFEPPEPGPIEDASYDQKTHESCVDFVPDEWEDRCIEETPLDNHRYIIDGFGSRTVFNGHEPLVDLLYTRANAYVSANWDGFHDDETGIFGYTWTVGTEPCLDNVHPHKDPHSHLFDESEWTHVGVAYPLSVKYLPDGQYHVSVRALNKVELGGPLATTVCHSTPYTIDNTPPMVNEVFNVDYDETDCTIRTEYNVSDDLSNIREVDFGLGRSSRDVYIMDWERESNRTHIAVQFCIPDGIPAWIKIRAINNVDLRTVGHAPAPLIVDRSPPVAGEVFDGTVHDHDIDYQSFNDMICVSWHNFYDQESGIEKYIWFVGTSPGDNDTVANTELSHTEYRVCNTDVLLTHNVTYYSTIIAFNAGHKNLQTSVTTDGVLYDSTPPERGWVKDGLDPEEDMVYSSEPATVAANWDEFFDPESDIKEYTVTVWRKHAEEANATYPTTIIHEPESVSPDSNFINWHHFHLHDGDRVHVELEAVNNALGGTDVSTDGFIIDLSEPVLYFLGDGSTSGMDQRFTASNKELSANWQFEDLQSGVDHYKLSIYETFGGTRRQIYPFVEPYETLDGRSTEWTSIEDLPLKTGGHYEVRVSAVNGAGLTNVQDTDGVIVDPTPPVMRVLSLGTLTPGGEELFDGFVIDTDVEGIKAYWKGTDFESGIDGYFVAVGTSPGGTDMVDFTDMGPSPGGYIGGLNLNLYDEANDSTVYYVSVKAQNGAETFSEVKTSSPLKIVSGDKIGFVIDGPEEIDTENQDADVDVDYQRESGTITAQFHGFESAQHGIVHYEWAVGSSGLADDVQPYISAGIVVPDDEEDAIVGEGIHGFGKAQALLALEPGTEYFTTVSAITGAGKVLETSSDGFTVDITPPTININNMREDNNNTDDLNTAGSSYQKAVESLVASWTVEEQESQIAFTEFCYGSYPGASDIYNCTDTTGVDYIPNVLVQPDDSKPNILTVKSINQVGLYGEAISESVTVDTTPPVAGRVTCPSFMGSNDLLVCSWSDFRDEESGIAYYQFGLGVSEGDDTLLPFTVVDASQSSHAARDFIGGALQTGRYYVTVSATNHVGDSVKAYSAEIVVDETPPIAGKVVELTGVDEVRFDSGTESSTSVTSGCLANDDCDEIDAICQSDTDRIHVSWQPFQDQDTPIVRYQLAVGTSPGGTQLLDFYDIEHNDEYVALIRNVDLYNVRRAYVSVRGYNAAGLYTTATSNGVFISRISAGLPPIGDSYVWDGRKEEDLDYQDNNEELSGQWSFEGDPCPIAKYEWSIMRFDGVVVQPLIELPSGLTHGVNDELNMKDGESYYLVVRATNELGYTYSLRSDGITIQKEPLLPGHVRDGAVMGYDLNFQGSITSLSANWDDFGIDTLVNIGEEDADHQIIDHYEVAAGTDRRYPSTRDDVHPFTDVGLNKSHTFYDLSLVPRKLSYYVTVRAYSKSTATAQITSNGIKVGYGGTVLSTGEISVPRYIASTSSMSVSWSKFEFGMPILLYQWGISSVNDIWPTISCFDLQNFNEDGDVESNQLFSHLFEGHPLTNSGKDSMVKLSNLELQDKETYTFVVIATDESAQCSLVTAEFTVDLTAPVEGRLRIGAFDDQSVTFAYREDILDVSWDGYYDHESGIDAYTLAIYDGLSCTGSSDPIALQEGIQVLANDTAYTFVDLTLQPGRPYYVQLTSINNAELDTTTISRPILLDLSDPVPGIVKDGSVFSDDVEYQSTTTQIEGVFLHLPNPSGSPCPSRQFPFVGDVDGDDDFSSVNSEGVWGISDSSVKFRPKQLSLADTEDDLSITLTRDVKRPRMYSGAYYSTNPDAHEGGKYQIDVLAASGDVPAVTSVVFWDGPAGVVGDFDAPVGESNWEDMDREYDLCRQCCVRNDSLIDGGNAECRCNCTEYFMRPIATTTRAPPTTMATETLTPGTTSSPWEIIEDGDPDDTFDGDEGMKGISYQSMGFQLHPAVDVDGDMKHYAVIWFRYQNSTDAVKYEITELDFDPSEAWHSYTFDVIPNKNDLSVELKVDGRSKIFMSGLVPFGKATKFIMSVWNRHGVVPDFDDVFNPPTVVGHFRNLRFPPTSEALCRFGDPFRNGDAAIFAFFAGVGSSRLTDDVVPFREVSRPCVPCAKPCDILDCDSSCSNTAVTDYPVVLDGLNLAVNRTVEEDGELQTVPAVYHLTIKAVTGSGRSVLASSDGVYVDDTPPEFDYLYHVDLDWSEDAPVEYQGSNTTIAVRFSAFDIGSQIREFRWSIGTQPRGTDIQDTTSVGFDTFLVKDNLNLKDRQTYYVTVDAVNQAGLVTSITTSGVTIITTPPDTSASNTTTECGDMQDDVDVTLCGDQSSVGMTWTRIDDDSVDAYYYQIGSRDDLQDIFPKLRVGYNTSGTVLIKDGKVYIGDTPLANISGIREIADGEAGIAQEPHQTDNNRFLMEPGRTLHSELIACNRGHKCGKVSSSKATIKREEDKIATAVNDSNVVISFQGPSANTTGRENLPFVEIETENDVDVVISKRQASEDNGLMTLMAGLLTDSDLAAQYTSDASPFFKPYIVDPQTTKGRTNRFLRDRIKDAVGPTFYVTSVGDKSLSGPIRITLRFNSSLFNVTDVERYPSIMFWHTDLQEWQDASQTCQASYGNYDIDWENDVISVEVCATDTEQDSATGKSKRAVDQSYFAGPTEFTFASVGSFTNSPPRVTSTDNIWMREDGGTLRFQVTAEDDDGDDLVFRLNDDLDRPRLGSVSLSVDGELIYQPCLDCFGTDYIHFVVTEDRADGSDLLSTHATIEVQVRQENDNPEIFLSVDHSSALEVSQYEMSVTMEERKETENDTTYTGFTAIAGAFDVDTFDALTVTFDLPQHGHLFTGVQHSDVSIIHQDCSRLDNITEEHLSFESPETPDVIFPCGLALPHDEKRLAWVFSAIRYLPDTGYVGEDTFKINVIDQDGYHTEVIVIHIYVLANPCMNDAVCVGPGTDPNCTSPQRSLGFHDYQCKCTPGYVGEYCDTDYNECYDTPCDFNFTCTDMVDAYSCHCENLNWPCGGTTFPAYLAGSICVAVVLLTIIAVLVFRRIKSKKKSNKIAPETEDTKNVYEYVAASNAAFEMEDVFTTTTDGKQQDDAQSFDPEFDSRDVLKDSCDLTSVSDQDSPVQDAADQEEICDEVEDVENVESGDSETEEIVFSVPQRFGFVTRPSAPGQAWGRDKPKKRRDKRVTISIVNLRDDEDVDDSVV